MSKQNKSIDRQEDFAKQNFSGLEEAVEQMDLKAEQIHKLRVEARELSKKDDPSWETVREEADQLTDTLSIDIMMIKIKLNNTLGHALNARSVKMIKKLLKFMDKNSIGNEIVENSLIKVASNKHSNGTLLDMATLVAIKNDDLNFLKYIEDFSKRNDTRNEYETRFSELKGTSYEYREMRNMNNLRLSGGYKDSNRFDALLVGSKDIYMYLTNNKGISKDELEIYLTNNSWSIKDDDITGILTCDVNFITLITEVMPELLPQDILDIFFI